ncbi:MAG: M48 family metalloprotease [Crocinitomicaceae bacterium]|nr:M48 family metalloprotease [Crocinitomicaceae bacterium]
MKNIFFRNIFILSNLLLLSTCGNFGKNINLFTIEDDKTLGRQVAADIASKPEEFPILDRTKYAAAYDYLYGIRDKILNAGNVRFKNEFDWELFIIHNDSTLNAFCSPGGYIYFYTGILKFLDAEDQLAGVLGHEIAHADLRHSTRQITRMYGLQTLTRIVTSEESLPAQVLNGIIGLRFSRDHETEADGSSVHYLCPTNYDATGGAKFFEKIQALGGARMPEFLSTHPNPTNRIEHFHNQSTAHSCSGNNEYRERYQTFLKTLP